MYFSDLKLITDMINNNNNNDIQCVGGNLNLSKIIVLLFSEIVNIAW